MSPGFVNLWGDAGGVAGEGGGRLQGVPGHLGVDGVLALHRGRGVLGGGGDGGGKLCVLNKFCILQAVSGDILDISIISRPKL